MQKCLSILFCAMLITACSGSKDAPLPKNLEKIKNIQSVIDRLSKNDQQLLEGYVTRKTSPGSEGIPDGMTLGKAIEDERNFKAVALVGKS